MTVHFIKASKGESLWQDGMHDGSDSPSPLPSSNDEKQVTGPADSHKKGSTPGCGHQKAGILGASLRVCLSQYANFIFAAHAYTTTEISGPMEHYVEMII